MLWSIVLLHAAAISDTGGGNTVTVFKHGEGGFPCIRIPTTLAVPVPTLTDQQNQSYTTTQDAPYTLLMFAAARSFTGDSCFPSHPLPGANNYSAHVVKRSIDGGMTWSPMVEMKQRVLGQ